MNIIVKQLNKKAESPIVNEHNSLKFKAIEIGTKIGKDGRLVLVYKTGMAVIIPTGYIGIISQIEDASIKSLALTISTPIVYSNDDSELMVEFKTNTDSIPNIYEPNDIFCKLDIVKSEKLDIIFEESVEEEDTEEPKEEASNETI
jgi:hypothetical protein